MQSKCYLNQEELHRLAVEEELKEAKSALHCLIRLHAPVPAPDEIVKNAQTAAAFEQCMYMEPRRFLKPNAAAILVAAHKIQLELGSPTFTAAKFIAEEYIAELNAFQEFLASKKATSD